MPELCTIYDYMRNHAALLGERILQEYPALHQFDATATRSGNRSSLSSKTAVL